MGKIQKYDDELLTDAVIRYSEQFPRKIIKFTELASWASEFVPGLESVRDYHFSRPVIVENSKTKKREKKEKLCTKRIHEINAARESKVVLKKNPLLSASDVEGFLALPSLEQRKLILEARGQIEVIENQARKTGIENARLQAENKDLEKRLSEYEAHLKAATKTQNHLKKMLHGIINYVNDDLVRQAMQSMGLIDGQPRDLNTFLLSVESDIEVCFMLGEKKQVENDEFVNELISDIQF